jgi:hypothetical protein
MAGKRMNRSQGEKRAKPSQVSREGTRAKMLWAGSAFAYAIWPRHNLCHLAQTQAPFTPPAVMGRAACGHRWAARPLKERCRLSAGFQRGSRQGRGSAAPGSPTPAAPGSPTPRAALARFLGARPCPARPVRCARQGSCEHPPRLQGGRRALPGRPKTRCGQLVGARPRLHCRLHQSANHHLPYCPCPANVQDLAPPLRPCPRMSRAAAPPPARLAACSRAPRFREWGR